MTLVLGSWQITQTTTACRTSSVQFWMKWWIEKWLPVKTQKRGCKLSKNWTKTVEQTRTPRSYPSLDIDFTRKEICQMFMRSDITIKGVDYKEIGFLQFATSSPGFGMTADLFWREEIRFDGNFDGLKLQSFWRKDRDFFPGAVTEWSQHY